MFYKHAKGLKISHPLFDSGFSYLYFDHAEQVINSFLCGTSVLA